MRKINNVIFASITVMIVVWISTLFFTKKVEEKQMITEWIRHKTLSSIAWEYEEVTETEQIEELEEYITHKEVVIEQSSSFKSYMPYTAITSKTSKQYELSQLCTTNELGLRIIQDRFCVAVGTTVTSEIGTYIDVVLKNGTIISCVVGDVKANVHTNSDNITTSTNGCVCEFIIDKETLPRKIKRSGNISYCYEEWMSPVEKIIVYERSVFNEK
jgi:hypothetical protein